MVISSLLQKHAVACRKYGLLEFHSIYSSYHSLLSCLQCILFFTVSENIQM